MPDDTALALANALLRFLQGGVLVRARNLLDAVVEDDGVADKVNLLPEQPTTTSREEFANQITIEAQGKVDFGIKLHSFRNRISSVDGTIQQSRRKSCSSLVYEHCICQGGF